MLEHLFPSCDPLTVLQYGGEFLFHRDRLPLSAAPELTGSCLGIASGGGGANELSVQWEWRGERGERDGRS